MKDLVEKSIEFSKGFFSKEDVDLINYGSSEQPEIFKDYELRNYLMEVEYGLR